VLFASCKHSLQHELDRFSAAYEEAGMKINTKTTEVLRLYRNPRKTVSERIAVMHCSRGVQPCSTDEPNAHNQLGP